MNDLESTSIVWVARHLPEEERLTFYVNLFNQLGQVHVNDNDNVVVRKRIAIIILTHFDKYYHDDRLINTVNSYALLAQNNPYHSVMKRFHEQKPRIRSWGFYRVWAQTLFETKAPADELAFVKDAAIKFCPNQVVEISQFFSYEGRGGSRSASTSNAPVASVPSKPAPISYKPQAFAAPKDIQPIQQAAMPMASNQQVHLTSSAAQGSHQQYVSASPRLSVVAEIEELSARNSMNPSAISDFHAAREPTVLSSDGSKGLSLPTSTVRAEFSGNTGGSRDRLSGFSALSESTMSTTSPAPAPAARAATPTSPPVKPLILRRDRRQSPPGFNDSIRDSFGNRPSDYGMVERVDTEPDDKPHVAEHSFTTRIYQNNYNAFGNTLPFSQEKPADEDEALVKALGAAGDETKTPGSFATSFNKTADSDASFSVYCDSVYAGAAKEKEKPLVRPFQKDSTIQESPLAKRNKFSDSIFGSDDEFGSSFTDEKTVAGLGNMGADGATSTPVGPARSKPMFPDNVTAIIPLGGAPSAPKKDDGKKKSPFKFAPAPVAEPRPYERRRSEYNPPMEVEVKEEPMAESPAVAAPSVMSPAVERVEENLQQSLDDMNLDDTTHNLDTLPRANIQGGINPWSDKTRNAILERFVPLVTMHEMNTVAPAIKVGHQPDLGGEKYTIRKIIGQGAFARVYLGESLEERENGGLVAMKHESPACPWEVYICHQLKRQVPKEGHSLLMTVHDSYIFTNASIIIYDFHPYGTVLDLVNNFRTNNQNIDSVVTGLVALQLSQALEYTHNAKIIHSDVKPDNIIITHPLDMVYRRGAPFIKLIDWGRSIDMSVFPGQQFTGRAGTDGFDCIEMRSNRPWTYQTDFYGWAATIHVVVLNSYMATCVVSQNQNGTVQKFRRRNHFYEVFTKAISDFLNIPSCDELPTWRPYITAIENRLDEVLTEDPTLWTTAVDRINPFLMKEATNKESRG
uniref:Protein kinase domain-containing protein n=1 Tax=Panagrellus redivivus TaxID=6233 RepID=A0A7E4VT60_PANRE